MHFIIRLIRLESPAESNLKGQIYPLSSAFYAIFVNLRPTSVMILNQYLCSSSKKTHPYSVSFFPFEQFVHAAT